MASKTKPGLVREQMTFRREARLKHHIEDLSYAGGWSLCACGFRVEDDPGEPYAERRQRATAEAMTTHIAIGNGRRPWVQLEPD